MIQHCTSWTNIQVLIKDQCMHTYICHLWMPSAMTILHCLQNVHIEINSDSVTNFEFQWNSRCRCYFNPISYSSQYPDVLLSVGLTVELSYSTTLQQWLHVLCIIIPIPVNNAGRYNIWQSAQYSNSKFNTKFIYLNKTFFNSITLKTNFFKNPFWYESNTI